jgi:hypothetical protein
MSNFTHCYAGIRDGKMILTPAFEQSLMRFYASQGWPYLSQQPSRAMDSAEPEESPNPRGDRYRALQDLYNRLRRQPGGIQPTDHSEQIRDPRQHAEETRDRGIRDVGTVARFRRVRGLDAFPIRKVARYLALETALDAIRRRSQ